VLPVVVADTGLIVVVVDAKTTASAKIVAALARYMLCKSVFLLLLLAFSFFI
jgi:hypothetical protein